MEKNNKTLEERVAALELSNKPKFKSFFDNNLGDSANVNQIKNLIRQIELLDRRIKILEKGK